MSFSHQEHEKEQLLLDINNNLTIRECLTLLKALEKEFHDPNYALALLKSLISIGLFFVVLGAVFLYKGSELEELAGNKLIITGLVFLTPGSILLGSAIFGGASALAFSYFMPEDLTFAHIQQYKKNDYLRIQALALKLKINISNDLTLTQFINDLNNHPNKLKDNARQSFLQGSLERNKGTPIHSFFYSLGSEQKNIVKQIFDYAELIPSSR